MFRFKLAKMGGRGSAATAAYGAPASPWKPLLILSVILLGLGITAGWLLGTRTSRKADLEPEMGAVVLQMQKLGQLHTVSFTMKDVLRQESQQEPNGLASHLPGGESLVHWATHNQALVVAEGSVEAGVDLAQLTEKDVTRVPDKDGKTILRVRLPAVTVYPPNVRVRVENSSSGMFWNDQNLVPKAQEQASRRFLEAADRQNIRSAAQTNAIEALKKMQNTFGPNKIEFYFAEPGRSPLPTP